MHTITASFAAHYAAAFDRHGPTAKGVDWGDEPTARLRYEKMLAVIPQQLLASGVNLSLLDVGCGFGGLAFYARERNVPVQYTGIDVAQNMLEFGRNNLKSAKFVHGDFLDTSYVREFDFVTCNGILTQKLTASIAEMEIYSKKIIERMFSACKIGIAFNVMTSRVNFVRDNLFYKSPVEMVSYLLSEISSKIRLDHAYPLFEYTIYAFREDAVEI